jgi:agmatine deiminase
MSDIHASFRMPAEWEAHTRTWLSWPHHKADWPGKFAPIPWVFAEIARLISLSERVGLVVKDEAAKSAASETLDMAGVKLSQVDFLVRPTNRGWMRDCGAIFVKDEKGKRTALDFKFNAWAKYTNWQKDNKLAAEMATFSNVQALQPIHKGKQVVLEGGAIDVNGAGLMLTTEECLLSDVQCRNPGFSKDDYEQVFAECFGIEKTIWLDKGIIGDDTHGHIDDLARFVNETTILAVREKNKKDPNHEILEENWQILKKTKNQHGEKLNIIELPMPSPVLFEGEALPASYANFLITNGHVLVPLFNDPMDRIALNTLAECFPTREVTGIYSRDLILGLGTIHCLTQQEPK